METEALNISQLGKRTEIEPESIVLRVMSVLLFPTKYLEVF